MPEPVEPDQEGIDDQTQPVDDENPPVLPFPVVGIGASAGGLEAVMEFLTTLPAESGMAFVLIQHLPPEHDSMMAEILAKRTKIPVTAIEDGDRVEPNHLYVTRPGCSLLLDNGAFRWGEPLSKPNHNRPIDDFFKSLAGHQRERGIAIILSGMGSNGTAGAQAVKAVGGLCIAQEPESAQFPSMPRHLIDAGYADYILRPTDMPDVLLGYAAHPYAKGAREFKLSPAKREQQHIREIMAVLRTRTRHDFSGYKRPTVFRRIQRRMGLHRITDLADYARFLRQTPTEVTALADDLLIHVTGFFRDAEAWETLRQQVVVPLIASREAGASVRAWVTACSSGEEAYSLAMLLVEETERAGKTLDIKVFATDMAERSLQNARHGLYPGGIEVEITPARLDRFFLREDSVYRVRQDLRERVVFAPQNVLQDPPFSRLDIVSCRNLLIYLEPAVQARVLRLLHFGLREGGALFLGTSETTTADGLFETVDKKARIYRRVGPTRHGSVDFPLPHATNGGGWRGESGGTEIRPAVRPTIAQMTARALLEHHSPAAVTVDRELRVVYFHGPTETFLHTPRGEPTRDLLLLVRESIRGVVRSTLKQSMDQNSPVTVLDGWLETASDRRIRVAIGVSPLDAKPISDYFVVSFQERGEQTGAQIHTPASTAERDTADELVRVRDELQGTIEELQTSNEELKASHEEVVSTNEELQSTNEELETSREEMQSLNEELSTVNSQLHSKIDEHQAASNDLTSLLTSTAIAVLFLDTQFRIRRFTPQVLDLIDLIGTDIGRPMSDLAMKFVDPDLIADARAVLGKLVPVEKEVAAEKDRWFLRRVTPYRTGDNRIDGVVIVFVEITARRRAEAALRESEERFRLLVEGTTDFAMLMLDVGGKVVAWNTGAERLFGHSAADAMGQHVEMIFTPEDRAAKMPRRELELAIATGRAPDERWHLRKSGDRFWASGVMTPLRQDDGSLRGFLKVLRDETARKLAEQGLQVSKELAETANRVKDEFLATLSHELRTPLSAILLWTNLMRTGVVDPEKAREGLKAIEDSAEAQKALIEDLLDTSRITSGNLRLQMRDVDVAAVVRTAVEAIEPTGDAKGVEVSADLGPGLGFVRADPDRIRQVIWNLLTNAVKFTPAGGRVDVKLYRRSDDIEIRVSDTGRGIHPDFLPHVFERFRQSDSSHSRAQGGVGLGLAIAKQLVELHGGSITAESDGVGAGSAFVVTLPLPKIPRRERVKKPTPAVGVAPAGLPPMRLLLVEDDPSTRRAMTMLLRKAGVDVVAVDSAATGLAEFDRLQLDLIVSDIGLPGEDGHALMREVRRRERAAGRSPVPAVAVTAFAQESDREAAIAAGFGYHLSKPIDADRLLGLLYEIMAGE